VTTNFILNPFFKPPHLLQNGIGELKVAQHWKAGWRQDSWIRALVMTVKSAAIKAKRATVRALTFKKADVIKAREQGILVRPEWREAADDWDRAQQFFCTMSTMDAWTSQRVYIGAGNIGKTLVLEVVCAVESIDELGRRGDAFASIGVDRWGHEDVGRKTITWLTPVYQEDVGPWTTLRLEVVPEKEFVTVYAQCTNSWKIGTSMFIKSASLTVKKAESGGDGEDEPNLEPGDLDTWGDRIVSAIESTKSLVLGQLLRKPNHDDFQSPVK